MSLSKQERPEDHLSALDFLAGHGKVYSFETRLQKDLKKKKRDFFGLNIKHFFTSRIGKPTNSKEWQKHAIMQEAIDESEEEQFPWVDLPDDLRETIVHKMPLQTRINLAATSREERSFVKNMKVDCKLFVIEDMSRRTTNILRYPELYDKVYSKSGKKYFVNFQCDWEHDIAVCFCEQRRPFSGTSAKVYWISPGGNIKKTVVPGASAYDLAVQTARGFFKVITEDCKRASIALAGWPEEVFQIPELSKSYIIGSSYDDVESIHKTYDFFQPFSFDVYMHKTAIKYIWPFSLLSVARHGLTGWMRMKARDRALSDQMLDKDLRILILHDSFVSIDAMNGFMKRWENGQISDKFCWWAISTHVYIEVEEVIQGLNVMFIEERFGPKYNFAKEESKRRPKDIQMVRMVRYELQSRVDGSLYGTIIVRDKMILFANAGCAPRVDEFGLVTYKTRSGINETQF